MNSSTKASISLRFLCNIMAFLVLTWLIGVGTVFSAELSVANNPNFKEFKTFVEKLRSEGVADKLGVLPIQQQGRLKPLDSFARSLLLALYHRQKIEGVQAIEWLIHVLLAPEESYDLPVFRILNPGTVSTLGLKAEDRKRPIYSFNEISKGLGRLEDMINSLKALDEKKITQAQVQLILLYENASLFYEVSRSLTLISPDYDFSADIHSQVVSDELSRVLEVLPRENYSYMQLIHVGRKIRSEKIKEQDFTEEDSVKYFKWLGASLSQKDEDRDSRILRVFPPQWPEHGEEWFSPWSGFSGGRGSPKTAESLKLWKNLIVEYKSASTSASRENLVGAVAALSEEMNRSSEKWVSKNRLLMERTLNKYDFFQKSLILYLLGLFFFVALFWKSPGVAEKGLYVFSIFGGIAHFLGLGLRVYILQRPPVSTLYESIVFVAFVVAVFGLYLGLKKKSSLASLLAILGAVVLLFVSLSYAKDGDTLQNLVAVLNTNFWLATHVVVITIGYGCSLLVALLGHLYLWQTATFRLKESKEKTFGFLHGFSLVAAFFTMFGTILGGIWADQSWGRFWGWDPKENGALLIVLWLLWLMHGRISGVLKANAYAFGLCILNIIVALAWFGVNLLSVGLHSYGFTENILMNLMGFCLFELVLSAGLFFWAQSSEKKRLESGGA